MERSQPLIILPHTGNVMVKIIIIAKQLFIILIQCDIAVQRKNQPIQRRNLPDGRNRPAPVQLVKNVLPFFAADLDDKLKLARIIPKKRCAPDTCSLRDLSHTDRFDGLFHKNIKRSIQDLYLTFVYFSFCRISHKYSISLSFF